MPPLAQTPVRPTGSVSQVVQRYQRHGFPSRFVARPGGSAGCRACERDRRESVLGIGLRIGL